ncbi:protein SGT1 homolog A-like [Acropora millepora]|uniref:protein SGT1 homolog A-like n=1 Tax=Acropora millepora TaxID=45264 RepID=UPI001CF5661F|nr:protein SGT1 homolog A-like [Acropora millepora]
MASELIREGNEAFVDDNYDLAVKKYTEAIQLSGSDAEFFLKRAAAYMKLGQFEQAAADGSAAVNLQPKNSKAHARKGIALFNLEDYEAAKQSFADALQLDKDNKELQTWIGKCNDQLGSNVENCGAGVAEKVEDVPQKFSNKASEEALQPAATVQSSNPAACDAEATTSADSSMSVPADSEMQPLHEQPQAPAAPPKPRFDWYQTETHVVVTLMIKKSKKENVNVDYGEKTLSVTVKLPSGSEFVLDLDLSHTIVPAQCKTVIMSTKIELKMKKAEAIRWSSLEAEDEIQPKPPTKNDKSSDLPDVHKYPSSRHVGKDWDKVAAQIAKEEKDEKLEGDAALNQLFQQIYGDGSEEVRKAMNKSFVESGGTVLSTNWDEVKRGHVDCKPPDGMEWKTWEK